MKSQGNIRVRGIRKRKAEGIAPRELNHLLHCQFPVSRGWAGFGCPSYDPSHDRCTRVGSRGRAKLWSYSAIPVGDSSGMPDSCGPVQTPLWRSFGEGINRISLSRSLFLSRSPFLPLSLFLTPTPQPFYLSNKNKHISFPKRMESREN